MAARRTSADGEHQVVDDRLNAIFANAIFNGLNDRVHPCGIHEVRLEGGTHFGLCSFDPSFGIRSPIPLEIASVLPMREDKIINSERETTPADDGVCVHVAEVSRLLGGAVGNGKIIFLVFERGEGRGPAYQPSARIHPRSTHGPRPKTRRSIDLDFLRSKFGSRKRLRRVNKLNSIVTRRSCLH